MTITLKILYNLLNTLKTRGLNLEEAEILRDLINNIIGNKPIEVIQERFYKLYPQLKALHMYQSLKNYNLLETITDLYEQVLLSIDSKRRELNTLMNTIIENMTMDITTASQISNIINNIILLRQQSDDNIIQYTFKSQIDLFINNCNSDIKYMNDVIDTDNDCTRLEDFIRQYSLGSILIMHMNIYETKLQMLYEFYDKLDEYYSLIYNNPVQFTVLQDLVDNLRILYYIHSEIKNNYKKRKNYYMQLLKKIERIFEKGLEKKGCKPLNEIRLKIYSLKSVSDKIDKIIPYNDRNEKLFISISDLIIFRKPPNIRKRKA